MKAVLEYTRQFVCLKLLNLRSSYCDIWPASGRLSTFKKSTASCTVLNAISPNQVSCHAWHNFLFRNRWSRQCNCNVLMVRGVSTSFFIFWEPEHWQLSISSGIVAIYSCTIRIQAFPFSTFFMYLYIHINYQQEKRKQESNIHWKYALLNIKALSKVN